MPTLEENRHFWDSKYDWGKAGESWSSTWGTSYMQWYGTILPRICAFLPAGTILEIAPGFGRWTAFLKDFCRQMVLVDLSEKCIKGCQERFADASHISYYVNDGTSLDMIPDNSIDFVFSFDSLVHAEDAVLAAYINQLSKKMKDNGVAFIHHSNLGSYPKYLKIQSMASKIPKLVGGLRLLRILDTVGYQWRDQTMSADKMEAYAASNGMGCISQELVTWGSRRVLVDCISTISKRGSDWHRERKVFKNPFFMNEAKNFANLSCLYGPQLHKDVPPLA